MNREVCEHCHEVDKCEICTAIRVINRLLNVLPIMPLQFRNIRGYEDAYNRAVKDAMQFVKDNSQ